MKTPGIFDIDPLLSEQSGKFCSGEFLFSESDLTDNPAGGNRRQWEVSPSRNPPGEVQQSPLQARLYIVSLTPQISEVIIRKNAEYGPE